MVDIIMGILGFVLGIGILVLPAIIVLKKVAKKEPKIEQPKKVIKLSKRRKSKKKSKK